jgi:hypothetical protein
VTPLVFVVAALLAYRLTMLVVADELTEPIRERIVTRYVHPAHERILDVDTFESPGIVKDPNARRFYQQCRCGLAVTGEKWSDVASEMNGHLNPNRVEMTTGPKWLLLLDCPWCASFWISIPVAWSAWSWGDRGWWFVPTSAFAFSALAGILSTFAKPGS